MMDSKLKTFCQELQHDSSTSKGTRQKTSLGRVPRTNEGHRDSSRAEAKLVGSCGTQGNLQPTSLPSKPLARQKGVDKMEEQILNALKTVVSHQKKITTPRSFSKDVATNREQSCSIVKPVVQGTNDNRTLLTFKSANGQSKVPEESVEDNIKKKGEVSNSLRIADQGDTPTTPPEPISPKGEQLDKGIVQQPKLLEQEERLALITDQKQDQEAVLKQLAYQIEVASKESTFEVQSHQPIVTPAEPLSLPDAATTFKDDQSELKCEALPQPKHCKETHSFNDKSSLFILVSTQDEKRFGLENIKEFSVSKKVFDEIIPNFKTFEFETSFESKRFMCSKLDLSFENSMKFKTFSKDLIFDNCFSSLAQFNLFASNRKSLTDLCSKKHFCVDQRLNSVLGYDLDYTLFFDHTDIIYLSWSKECNAGLRIFLKYTRKKRCKRRSQRKDEDKRFKPPDLDQDIHQDIRFFQHVKEAPPDLKPSQDGSRGMSLSLHIFINTNLSYVYVDCSDLRTNPFEEGGDDVILRSNRQRRKEEKKPTRGNLDHRPNIPDLRPEAIDPRPGTLDRRPVILDLRPGNLDRRPRLLDHSTRNHRPPDCRPSTTRPSAIDPRPPDHSTMVDHSWPVVGVIIRSSQGERPEPEHEPEGPCVLIQA